MSEEQQAQPAATSYDGLQKDQNVIDAMYYSLESLGEPVAYGNNKDILDAFLTQNRYFESNLLDTVQVGSKVEDMDDTDRHLLGVSMDAVNRMPSFGEDSAPKLAAIVDYGIGGITDPTNIASAIAGAFTAGGGTVAIQATKEAAKQGIKKYIQAKMKTLISPAVLKSLAAEGAVAGTGGAYQNYDKQNTQIDLNLREEINPTEIAIQGIAEGTLSPLLGAGVATVGGIGTTAIKTSSPYKYVNEIPSVERASAWLERNLSPTAGVSETQRRLIERRSGEASSIKQQGEELTEELDEIIKRDFVTDSSGSLSAADKQFVEGQESIINKALQGDEEALGQLADRSVDARTVIDNFFTVRDSAFKYGKSSKLNPQTIGTFNKDANYVRSVPEAYATTKRAKNFDQFLKDEPNILEELKVNMRDDPSNKRWSSFTKKYIDEKGIRVGSDSLEDKAVRQFAEQLYKPTRQFRKETGAFEKKLDTQELPSTVKKILGYNTRPALRVAETINAIMDTAVRSNTAADIAGDAIRRGVGVRATDPATAAQQLGVDDVISLAGSVQKKAFKGKQPELEDTVMNLPFGRIDDDLKNVYITKEEGLKLKELLTEDFIGSSLTTRDDLIGSLSRGVMNVQGFTKAGKTIYSPLSQLRNIAGAVGYTVASGNVKGVKDGLTAWKSMYKGGKSDNELQQSLINEFKEMGLQGSSIDLNQTLRRFGDISERMDDGTFIEKFTISGGGSVLGKPGRGVSKAARKAYGASDDAFKFGAYVNERKKASDVFDNYSPEARQQKLADFEREYQITPGTATKEDYIKEKASINTANITPIYSRIPPLLEKMRQVPVLGTFTAYPAERLRNSYNVLKLGSDEMIEGFETGNKVLRNQGLKRLGQWYAAQGAIYTGAYAANEAAGNSELLEKMRSSLPDWEKDAALLITGADKDGNPTYINLSYLNPDQQLADAIMPIMLKAGRGEDVTKDLDKSLYRAATNIFKPYLSPSLAVEAGKPMFDIVKSVISGEGLPDDSILKLVKTVEPGYTKMVRDMAQDANVFENFGEIGTDAERFFYPQTFGNTGDDAEGFFDLLEKNGLYFGTKEQVFDPKKVMGYSLNTINSNGKDIANDFRIDLREQLSDPRTLYTPENILKDYDEVLQQQFVGQQSMHKLFKDMKGIVGDDKLRKYLRSVDLQGVIPSKNSIASIIRGDLKPIRQSQNSKFWKDRERQLREKTGNSYARELSNLRQDMSKLELFYMNSNLLGDPPDVVIGED